VVAAIDQMILPLSIPRMWNLARNILGFGAESILIILSCCFTNIEKRGNEIQVIHIHDNYD